MGADIDFVVPYESDHHFDYMNVLSATHVDPLFRYGGASNGAYESKNIEKQIFPEISPAALFYGEQRPDGQNRCDDNVN